MLEICDFLFHSLLGGRVCPSNPGLEDTPGPVSQFVPGLWFPPPEAGVSGGTQAHPMFT